MTKLRWEKVDEHVPDPGSVVQVEESTRPERWTPPQERERKKTERAKRDRELRERSERRDWELLRAGTERRTRAMEEREEPLSGLEELFLKDRQNGAEN
jgi:hypothetical protein